MVKNKIHSDDDADLDDLLSHKGGDKNQEVTPLNLDHLTKGDIDVPSKRTFGGPNIFSLINAHCRYLCFMYPACCGCVSVTGVAFIMFFLLGAVLNPTETFGVIKSDYSGITSEYDLTTGKIDHWCLKGDNDSCRCQDPTDPISRIEFKMWNDAHKDNKRKVEAYRESDYLDVAFIGESLVEEMDGRWLGRPRGEELKSIEKVFKKQFKRENSGMEGVALGIAGDTSPNVLWRLLHGEMPTDFNPRVFWLVLGMNDLGRMQCSEEVVVLGILRVVEEILSRRPDAKIVINSMLPMADLRGGEFPQMTDYKDAFKNLKNKRNGMLGKNANPALYARPPPGAMGDGAAAAAGAAVAAAAKVTYQRPKTTTDVLTKRNRGAKNPMKPGTIPGSNPGAMVPQAMVTPGAMLSAGAGAAGDAGAPAKKTVPDKPANEKKGDAGRRALKKDDEAKDDEPKTKQEKKEEKKAEKKVMKQIKKDPVNPKLDMDKTKIKARDPKKLFLQKNRLPLWTSVNAINKELRKFAEKQDRVSFFDSTDIFAERAEGNKYVLQSDKISIRGHPTLLGFEKWEEAIATKLKKMFEKDDEDLAKEAAEDKKAEDAKASAAKPTAEESSDDSSSDDDEK